MRLRLLARFAPMLLIAAGPGVSPAWAQAPDRAAGGADSLLVSAEWLAEHLDDPRVIVLQVVHGHNEFRRGHIPGARPLSYMAIAPERDGLGTELPPAERLRDLLESAGVSDDSYVVLYGDPIGMAARAFFTLEYIGLPRVALLDGGLAAWRAAGRSVSRDEPQITRGSITPRLQPVAVDAAWMVTNTGRPGFTLLDTRTDEEYNGTGGRRGMPSTGHIAGARQLQWQELFSDPSTGRFLPRDELERVYAQLVSPGDTVITYCYVGYRASLTYFAARLLGYRARMYDGSYQDWAERGLPLVKPVSGGR